MSVCGWRLERRWSCPFFEGHCAFRRYLNTYVIACKEINVLPRDRDHLPHCQTPSLKRIYTKAHSLNLHLLDLHPECWGTATRRERKRQREDSWDRPAQTVHTQVMRPQSLPTEADIFVAALIKQFTCRFVPNKILWRRNSVALSQTETCPTPQDKQLWSVSFG